MTSLMDATRRFGGLQRLYGTSVTSTLTQAHVLVAGLGGVGSWCAEALARTGVGRLTLIDLDHIAESNINRQVHALSHTMGQAKVTAMAERLQAINPAIELHLVDDFVTPENAPALLASHPNVVLDCTDDVPAKTALVCHATAMGLPLLVCGAAGGKYDPLSLQRGDLAQAQYDALLSRLRQQLRRHHGFPKGNAKAGKGQRSPKMGVQALWFAQETRLPEAWLQDSSDPLQGLSCAGYGSAVAMTATMGLVAADYAVQCLLKNAFNTAPV